MNVLYVDNQISGGSGESLMRMIAARDGRGKTLVAYNKRGYLSDRFETLPLARPPMHLPMRPWLTYSGKGTFPKLEIARGVVRQGASVARLVEAARDARIDLVHTNCIYLLEGALVARALGIPHLWQVRELVDLDYYQYEIAKTTAVAWVDRLSDAILAASDRCAEGLAGLGARRDKIHVVYNMVETDPTPRSLHARLGVDEDRPLVGIVGWITPNKAVEDFIDVASAMRDTSALFVIVGGFGHREAYNEKIRRQIKESTNRKNIVMTGVLENASAYLASLHALLCPCFTESFGRTIAEAMAAGTPPVGVDGTAASELIDHGETGFLVERGDTEAMEHRARELLGDAALRERLGAAARDRAVRDFSETTIHRQLEDVYAELVAARRRPR